MAKTLWLVGKDQAPAYVFKVEFTMTFDKIRQVVAMILFDYAISDDGEHWLARNITISEFKSSKKKAEYLIRRHIGFYGVADWNENTMSEDSTDLFNACYDEATEWVEEKYPELIKK